MNGHAVEILLVEDNPNDLELAMHAFREHDVCNRIEVARDGQEALDYLLGGHGREPGATPRVVLMDLKLPKVDGLQVLREIRSNPGCGRLPVVILTNSRERTTSSRATTCASTATSPNRSISTSSSTLVRTLGRYWLSLNEPPFAPSAGPESLGAFGPMSHALRVLLVEDSELDAELFLAELRRSGFETDCERVDTEAQFRDALSSAAWEMVVCDHTLPGFNSSEALRIVRESELDVPFVILSGTIGEEAAVEALKAGARDVVVKSNLARLGPVVDRVLHEAQNRRHQKQLELERTELQARLHHQAFHDALTGLPNRVLALDRAQQMLARARRQPTTVAALFIDVDGFKQVNDGFGHAAGDELLRQIASRLARVVREGDTAARLAGDEFVVLVDGAPELVAERLLEALRQPYEMTSEMGRQPSLTASIGIAVGERETAEELLRDADVALYEAKRAGGNRYVIFDPGDGDQDPRPADGERPTWARRSSATSCSCSTSRPSTCIRAGRSASRR